MAFSREAGAHEGAVLVIANTAKEARKLAWRWCMNVDDWLDQAALLIRDESVLRLADPVKLQAGEPHVVDSPVGCQACGYWGAGLTIDDLCGNCNEPPGNELINLLKAKQLEIDEAGE